MYYFIPEILRFLSVFCGYRGPSLLAVLVFSVLTVYGRKNFEYQGKTVIISLFIFEMPVLVFPV